MNLYQFLENAYSMFLAMPRHPLYLMGGLILLSFVFEDVAVAAGVAFSTAGSLLWSESFIAIWLGIAAGDLLLYATGFFSRKIPFLKRRFVDKPQVQEKVLNKHNLIATIFIARITPGLRLVTYVYVGFRHINFYRFTAIVMLAVLIWTASLYLTSFYLGAWIAQTLPIPKPIAVALPLLLLAIMTLIFPWARSKWQGNKHA
ncbi:membrane protein DedA, SNARE-associated domain [Polynucleobacter meluiroseus]|uniref:Membrane protein DedA, SNARE-associated domain n=1 Tax=Polynucleobacter meluiroseus TaxID=1938814 RepID=A0A240DXX6_9BURK|nr:VTT domain-containing protein [Polynucleobacter meluiroseus]SNX28049.1 membrane protein DedA, SNARE-associated domain [Polynucleobacter meluiroseus]